MSRVPCNRVRKINIHIDMESFLFSYFIFIQMLLSLSLVFPQHAFSFVQTRCHDHEKSALWQFKQIFIIDMSASHDPSSYPTLSSWNYNNDCCSWDGVDCNEDTGRVIGLDLSSSCLFGSINSNSTLFHLVHLQSLNLADNNFNYSTIPTRLAHLSHLTYLNLSRSRFFGQVPTEISQLSKLSSLDLSYNIDSVDKRLLRLEGFSFKSLIHNLTSLEKLILSTVDIASTVPERLANLSSLTTMNLESCSLLGEFPTKVFYLPLLQDLNVNFNYDLSGYLPEFDLRNSLKYLKVSSTSFSGMISSSLGNLSQLIELDLSYNNFSGHIPLSVGNLTKLTSLDLSSNNLQGPIPISLSQLKNLETLYLRENKLSGIVKLDMFFTMKNLSKFSLSANNFLVDTRTRWNTSSFPQFEFLGLLSCQLTEFPDFLRNQSKLSKLILASNSIQGLIPRWIYNTSSETLDLLNLSDNFLTGYDQSPAILPSKLETLFLNSNKLKGPLDSLHIPPLSINVYDVSDNKLTGEISPSICNLSSLHILALSSSNLGGKLPPCLGNFSSMSMLKLYGNNFCGSIPDTWTNNCRMRVMDLSENQFQGHLPRSLANCTLLELLDIKKNQIEDSFPFWLETLPELFALFMSSNRFHGAIGEPQSKVSFPKLQIIDLSHNNFSGHLPCGYFQQWNAMKVFDNTHKLTYLNGTFRGKNWTLSFFYSMKVTNKGIVQGYERLPDFLKMMDVQ